MDNLRNGFLLVSMNGLLVNSRVKIIIISEKLIDSFKFDRTNWSLAFCVNSNMGQVRVWEGSLDLTEVVVEAVGERTSQLG